MNNLKTTSAKIMGITLVSLVGISFVWAQDINENRPKGIQENERQEEEDLNSLYGGVDMSLLSTTEPDIHEAPVLINKTTLNPRFHLDVNGAVVGKSFSVYNPLNSAGQNGAVMLFDWYNNVSRIRMGGNGIGAGNGIDIQTVGNVSMMRIKYSGVGIGISNPTEKLDVAGNIKLSGNIVSDGDICIGHCQ